MESMHGKIEGELPPFLERLFGERVARFRLPNGFTVILKEDDSCKLASAQLWVKTGSIHENGFLGAGLSHYLEHMLFKGTERRPGSQISREVQAFGGYINAYTTFDRTVYYIESPCEETASAIDILCDMAFNSTLPAEEVEKEQGVILREIDMGQDDPDRKVSRALFSTAYREHPYRLPVIGHHQIFETVRRDDLVKYYRSRYVPNNIVLVVVGDIDAAAIKDVVEKTFGSYPRMSRSRPYIPHEPQQLAFREQHIYDDVNICRGGLGYKIPGMTHADAPALDILASVLGNGSSSILWRRLREELQLVHYIDASSWNPGSSGLFWISYVCDPDERKAAQAAILDELQRVSCEGISRERLDKALKQSMVSEVNIRKTMNGQASRLGLSEVVIGDLGYPRNYFQRIRQITPESLTALIDTYLVKESLTAVSLNSRSQAEPAEAREAALPETNDFEEDVLENGVRLLHQHDRHLPKINIRAVFQGGPLYEDASLRGITGVLATLLIKDTARRSAAEVADTIENVGGTFKEFAGNNTFGFSLEVMPQDFRLACELLEDGLLSPAFKEETFEREREAQIASVMEDMDEIVNFGKKRLRRHFFGSHPYCIDPYGTEETLSAVTSGDIKALYAKLVVGSNCVLSIAGDFDPEEALPHLKGILEKLPDVPFDIADSGFDGPQAQDCEETLPREQAVVFHAYPDTGVAGEDYHVGELLNELFSEMSGHLFTRVREERSLAYFVGANRMSGVRTGMFYLYAGTQPKTYKEVFAEFDAEIARVQAGKVTEEELERCQSRLKAAKRMGLQTIGARAMQAALNATYGLPINDWKDYDARIDSITVAGLQKFACAHFVPEKKISLVIKP